MATIDNGPIVVLLLVLVAVCSMCSGVAAQEMHAPTITHAPNDQKVVDHGTVSFFCEASGSPLPHIYWTRSNKPISTNRYRFIVVDTPHSSVLRIQPVRIGRDDHVFECVAENGIGEPATAKAVLEIYQTVPPGYPTIVESPTLKAVEKGHNTVMVCRAQGDPKPTIMWLKDYIPVDLQDPRLKLLPQGSLQIRESQQSDEGTYECIAQNTVGVAYTYEANLYVRVRRVPPHFSITPESPAEVMPGGAVDLTCVAVGSPMPYVRWRLGDQELTDEWDIPIGRNILQLVDIQESANYTCVAASELGSVEYVAEVLIKETTDGSNIKRGRWFG